MKNKNKILSFVEILIILFLVLTRNKQNMCITMFGENRQLVTDEPVDFGK